eukprot:1764833-Rhodomonas_salina.1
MISHRQIHALALCAMACAVAVVCLTSVMRSAGAPNPRAQALLSRAAPAKAHMQSLGANKVCARPRMCERGAREIKHTWS